MHVTFVCELENLTMPCSKNKTGTRSILLWDKMNVDTYLEVLDSELSKNFIHDQCSTTDSLNSITNVLKQARSKALPTKQPNYKVQSLNSHHKLRL